MSGGREGNNNVGNNGLPATDTGWDASAGLLGTQPRRVVVFPVEYIIHPVASAMPF